MLVVYVTSIGMPRSTDTTFCHKNAAERATIAVRSVGYFIGFLSRRFPPFEQRVGVVSGLTARPEGEVVFALQLDPPNTNELF